MFTMRYIKLLCFVLITKFEAINTRGINYDRRKSEAIATAANRTNEGGNESTLCFPNGVMDRQRLRSTKPIGNGNEANLAVGRFERIRDAEGKITQSVLHLTPIKNVLQMETSCEYLDTHRANTQVNMQSKYIYLCRVFFVVSQENCKLSMKEI